MNTTEGLKVEFGGDWGFDTSCTTVRFTAYYPPNGTGQHAVEVEIYNYEDKAWEALKMGGEDNGR